MRTVPRRRRAPQRAARRVAPDWDGAVAAARKRRLPRWTPELEEQCRASYRETERGLVPRLDPRVWAAVEEGLRAQPPSSVWGEMAASGPPVLLVTAESARAADVDRFRRAVPHAAVAAAPSPTHDLLVNAPSEVAAIVGDWLDGLAPGARP